MITIFTSCYNHAQYLPYAIESVLNQTYDDFEYLLYNDGSTDNTLEVMNSYNDPRIKVFDLPKQRNKGPVINRSIKEMRGTHWVWMPADDIFDSKLVEKKHLLSLEQPINTCIYSDYYFIDSDGNITGESNLLDRTPERLAQDVWKTTNLIGMTGIWIPQGVLKYLNFPNHIQYSEDFYWLILATIHNIPFIRLKERLYYKRKHPDSVTAKNYEAVMKDVDMIRTELNLYKELFH